MTEKNSNNKNNGVEFEVTTQISKEEIIKEIFEIKKEKAYLTAENILLQQRLTEFVKEEFEKDHSEYVELPKDADKNLLLRLLEEVDAKQDQIDTFLKSTQDELELLKNELMKKEADYNELKDELKKLKEDAALQSVNSDTGEKFSKEEITKFLRKEQDADEILQHYQLEAVRKKHTLQEVLQKKRNQVEGPVDFGEYDVMCTEIENIIEVSKQIQEETEEQRQKMSSMVNALGHLTQKLNFVHNEKSLAEKREKSLEDDLNNMRGNLFREKMEFTKINKRNKDLQHRFILLKHPNLIEDYKNLIAENEDAQKELERLKNNYKSCMKIVSESEK